MLKAQIPLLLKLGLVYVDIIAMAAMKLNLLKKNHNKYCSEYSFLQSQF